MESIAALLRIKHALDGLRAIDPTRLSERERYAHTDTLEHIYDRAAFFLAHLSRLSSQKGDTDATTAVLV